MKAIIKTLCFIFVCILGFCGCQPQKMTVVPKAMPPTPIMIAPRITVTGEGKVIDYEVVMTEWNRVVSKKDPLLILGSRSSNSFPWLNIGDVINITFPDGIPDSIYLEDCYVNDHGELMLDSRLIDKMPEDKIEVEGDKLSFRLMVNTASLLISDFNVTSCHRGFRLTCKWGKNECQYGFILQSNILPEIDDPTLWYKL